MVVGCSRLGRGNKLLTDCPQFGGRLHVVAGRRGGLHFALTVLFLNLFFFVRPAYQYWAQNFEIVLLKVEAVVVEHTRVGGAEDAGSGAVGRLLGEHPQRVDEHVLEEADPGEIAVVAEQLGGDEARMQSHARQARACEATRQLFGEQDVGQLAPLVGLEGRVGALGQQIVAVHFAPFLFP